MPDAMSPMYEGQPGTTDTLLYTAPATGATVLSIHVANTTGSAATITLGLRAGAALGVTNYFLPTISVPANDTYDWSGVQPLGGLETIRALQGTSGALTVTIGGVELSAGLLPTVSRWVDGRVAVDHARTLTDLTYATLTADATPHTKGAYGSIVTCSAPVTLIRVRVSATAVTATNTNTLLDLATVSDGSGGIWLNNLQVGWQEPVVQGGDIMNEFWFPTPGFAAGTVISGRIQSAVVSKTAKVSIDTFNGTDTATIDTLGANTATSQGVQVIAGLSDAEGSWTTIIAATTQNYKALMVGFGGNADPTLQNSMYLADIGKGAAASEVVLIPDIMLMTGGTEYVQTAAEFPTPITPIQAGTRLAARLQSAQANAQGLDVTLFGLR